MYMYMYIYICIFTYITTPAALQSSISPCPAPDIFVFSSCFPLLSIPQPPPPPSRPLSSFAAASASFMPANCGHDNQIKEPSEEGRRIATNSCALFNCI